MTPDERERLTVTAMALSKKTDIPFGFIWSAGAALLRAGHRDFDSGTLAKAAMYKQRLVETTVERNRRRFKDAD